MDSRAAGAAIGAGLILILALAFPAVALAHDELVDSTPGADSTIGELPEVFSVTTEETLLDLGDGTGFAIEVTDASGRFYGDGCVAVEEATLSTGADLGEPGDYTLTWQLVSEDGHTVSGSFGFTWTGEATATGSATPPDCSGTVVPSGSAAPEDDAVPGNLPLIVGAVLVAVLAVIAAAAGIVLVLRRRRV